MNGKFSWAKFDGELLHAIVYNDKTPKRYQLTYGKRQRNRRLSDTE